MCRRFSPLPPCLFLLKGHSRVLYGPLNGLSRGKSQGNVSGLSSPTSTE